MTYKNLFVATATLFLIGCGGGDNTKNTGDGTASGTPGAAPPVVNDNRPVLLLDGYYATSEAPLFAAERLFDANPKTGWRTHAGAAPDEGLMLYLSDQQEVDVAAVQVVAEPGSAFTANNHIQIYVNGQMNASGKAGEKIVLEKQQANQPVRSIYLRLAETGSEVEHRRNLPQGFVVMRTLPEHQFAGIESVTLFNAAGQPLRLVTPQRIAGRVQANTLAPESAYSPAHLFDARRDMVWVEGDKNGWAMGENLIFEFEKPVKITSLKITNGYQRSQAHYQSNARLKDFGIGASADNVKTYTLADRRAPQKIELTPPVSGNKLVLRLQSAYPGTKYKDLAISELLFFDGHQPFIITTDLPQKYESELRQKVANTPLAAWLNRRIYNYEEFGGSINTRSLILRSNGTFVMYAAMDDESATDETVADGNWEIVDVASDNIKIKIFGKWHHISTHWQPYQGENIQDNTRIFNEELTIDTEKVKGGKNVDIFWLK